MANTLEDVIRDVICMNFNEAGIIVEPGSDHLAKEITEAVREFINKNI